MQDQCQQSCSVCAAGIKPFFCSKNSSLRILQPLSRGMYIDQCDGITAKIWQKLWCNPALWLASKCTIALQAGKVQKMIDELLAEHEGQ